MSAAFDPHRDLLVGQLRTMARLVPDEVGFRDLDAGRGLTFDEWEATSNRLARGLVQAGIRKGERVAIHAPGHTALRWIVAYAAIHKAGAVAVPTNTRLTADELAAILGHAEVSGAFTSGELAEPFSGARADLDSLRLVVAVDDEGLDSVDGVDGVGGALAWSDVLADDDAPIQVEVDGDDLADIMYTSGTTGLPKGVAVSHANVAMVPNAEPEWSGEGWIHSSPLFTFAGIGFIYNPMKLGMASLYQPRFDAGRWIEHVEGERPRFAFIVPAMAQLIVHHPRFEEADLSSIQLCSVGSAPLPFEVLRALQEKMPEASVSNSYGVTEAGPAYSVMPRGEALRRKGSVGLPLPPTEIQIVDDEGRERGPNEEGQILIRAPGKQRSYYRDPEATARAWTEGGWLRTGDLGYLDEDGYLYIVGREKDVIIRGGHNIHAGDVEDVLHAHPAVLEAAVAGVPHEVLGEDVGAFVVLREDARDREGARERGGADAAAELEDFCRDRLADYKVPRTILVVDELPRNATGKVLKRQLVAQLEEASAEGAPGVSAR